MVLLGIDPGSRKTGWGVLRWEGSTVSALGWGIIESDDRSPMPERLRTLHEGLSRVIAQYRPQRAAIESLFHSRNVKSALVLAQARGVLLLAAAEAGLPVEEYAPLEVKRALTGYGRAEKSQLQYMIVKILGLSETPPPDASDALSVAFCCGSHSAMKSKLDGAR